MIFFAAPFYLPILYLLAQYTLHDFEHKPLINVILKCKEGRTKTKTSFKKTNFAHKIFTKVKKKRMRESDFNKC